MLKHYIHTGVSETVLETELEARDTFSIANSEVTDLGEDGGASGTIFVVVTISACTLTFTLWMA